MSKNLLKLMRIDNRTIFRVILALILIFFATKPYNNYCNNSGKCWPIYFSHFFSGSKGGLVNLEFEVTNYIPNLEFFFDKTEAEISTNELNELNLRVFNNGQDVVEFKIDMLSEPKDFYQYLIRYNCPCSQKYRLKKGEQKNIRVIFKVSKKFDEKNFDDSFQKIRFKTSKIN